jgi:catechol 2,3-dioxygenase-like lactoylglutathione lyase family enzyme
MFTDWKPDHAESFIFMNAAWDVSKAKEILRAKPRDDFPLEVQKYGALLEMIAGFSGNKMDLNVPVICVGVGMGLLPIDGWNRILSASRQQRATLPAVRLTKAEEALTMKTQTRTEGAAPSIKAIIETAIYVDGLDDAEDFYGTILGLRVIGKEPGRHVFFQVGEASVLLAFLAEATLKGDQLPPHGAGGPGHFALGIEAESFDAWRKILHSHGVTIEKEVEWPTGSKSLYFRDPAGNLVELVTPGVWGLPSGW